MVEIPTLEELRKNYDPCDQKADGPAFYQSGFKDAINQILLIYENYTLSQFAKEMKNLKEKIHD